SSLKHALTQEVAYRSQLVERRARVRTAVACAIDDLESRKLGERAPRRRLEAGVRRAPGRSGVPGEAPETRGGPRQRNQPEEGNARPLVGTRRSIYLSPAPCVCPARSSASRARSSSPGDRKSTRLNSSH